MARLNNNGAVLWEGASAIDGAPIVVIVTGLLSGSSNGKTGAMLQTWILRQDQHPGDARRSGADASICGDCPHRPANQGTCYVQMRAPAAVWRCYQRGGYRELTNLQELAGRVIRFGSYGDPAAAPRELWEGLRDVAAGHTGYTHQWRQPWAQWAKGILQASCDGMADYVEATAHGWSTFLVVAKGSARVAGTVHCAASAERGQKTTCQTCRLCDGGSANVVIWAHGATGGRVAATV
jgi:hypothetical protein